jgi:uncharacterized membrane-anchored protein
MNRELLLKIIFVPVMLLYIGVPAWMITRYESILNDGNLFRFHARPVDPYDAFRGRYITLSFTEEQNVSTQLCSDSVYGGDNVYVSVTKDPGGFAVISYISKTEVAGDCFEAKVLYVYDNTMTLHFPFDRYFMNEELAPLAEEAVRNNLVGRDSEVFVDVRIGDGKAVIEQIYIDGMTLKDYLEARPQ